MPETESGSNDSWYFPMRPSKPFRRGGELFREHLDANIDMSYPVVWACEMPFRKNRLAQRRHCQLPPSLGSMAASEGMAQNEARKVC